MYSTVGRAPRPWFSQMQVVPDERTVESCQSYEMTREIEIGLY